MAIEKRSENWWRALKLAAKKGPWVISSSGEIRNERNLLPLTVAKYEAPGALPEEDNLSLTVGEEREMDLASLTPTVELMERYGPEFLRARVVIIKTLKAKNDSLHARGLVLVAEMSIENALAHCLQLEPERV